MEGKFTLSRVTSGYSNSLANCGNEVVGKLRKIPGGKPWKSIGGKPWKHLVKGTEKKTVEHHATLFWAETHGHTLVENHGTL